MTLDQIILYHRHGWEARQTDYKVMWGVLGEIMAGKEGDAARGYIPKKISGLEEFKKSHPEGKNINGAWRTSV